MSQLGYGNSHIQNTEKHVVRQNHVLGTGLGVATFTMPLMVVFRRSMANIVKANLILKAWTNT